MLIDGHAILHRAYHALPATFTDAAGNPTNAVYGFSSMLIRILQLCEPDYLAVAFDHKGPTFRHSQLVTYKEGRPEMESSLASQIPVVKRMLRDMEVPFYEVEGYEGEDIIATIIEQALGRKFKSRCEKMGGLEILIVTGDRDTLQLVGPQVNILCPKKGLSETITYDENQVMREYGLIPAQIPDYKGLRGDPSDKIPGVKGIGEKTAIKLLKKYGTLEELYLHLGEVGKEIGTKLAEEAEMAALSKKLATITDEVPLKFDIADSIISSGFKANFKKTLSKSGFKSLVDRLENKKPLKKEAKSRKKAQILAEGQLGLI